MSSRRRTEKSNEKAPCTFTDFFSSAMIIMINAKCRSVLTFLFFFIQLLRAVYSLHHRLSHEYNTINCRRFYTEGNCFSLFSPRTDMKLNEYFAITYINIIPSIDKKGSTRTCTFRWPFKHMY